MAAPPAKAAAKRKGTISEDDVSVLLHKYTPTTILTLLQEVAQHAAARIDWKAVARKSATGITCPREYQMLWRHLAYGDELVERVETGAEPLDDESDLEYELEPVPTPTEEALSEAASCAKILISGSSREPAPAHRISSEAPSGSNITSEKIVHVPSDKQLSQNHRLTNVTGPVPNSKQAYHIGASVDPPGTNGPPKKKKKPKPWTKEEDLELTAAVRKYGEGNWLDILHGDYKHDRTPVQLSQRWATICKRQGSSKPAYTKPVSAASSEERKAAQMAFSLALDMPMSGLSTLKMAAPQQTVQHPPPSFGAIMPEAKPVAAPLPVPVPLPLSHFQQAPPQSAPQKVPNTLNKSRSNSKKQGAQPNSAVGPSMIQAAAIAAGGRIATASTAANLFKAAQSKNVVHIRSRGTGSSKSAKSSSTAGEPGTQPASAQNLEPPFSSSPTTSSALPTHITQQVHGVSEATGVNPPRHSAADHLPESRQILNTASTCGLHENMKKDNESKTSVITMEDLFPEDFKHPDVTDPKNAAVIDPKDASMLEFDCYVARQEQLNLVAQGCLNSDFLGKGKTDKDASEAQAVGTQKEQPKQLPSVSNRNPVLAGAPLAEKKTKTLVPDGITEISSSSGGTDIANVKKKTLFVKPATPAVLGNPNTVQKQQMECSEDNEMSKNVEVAAKAPANDQGNTKVNGVSNENCSER